MNWRQNTREDSVEAVKEENRIEKYGGQEVVGVQRLARHHHLQLHNHEFRSGTTDPRQTSRL